MSEAQVSQIKKADFREMPIFIAFFLWWLKVTPSKIIYIATKTIKKTYNFFSLDLLLKTLVDPWKRDEVDMTNMALDDKVRVLMMNLVSRLVGAVVRGGTVFVGAVIISLTFCMSVIMLVGFILLPVIICELLIMGLAVRGI